MREKAVANPSNHPLGATRKRITARMIGRLDPKGARPCGAPVSRPLAANHCGSRAALYLPQLAVLIGRMLYMFIEKRAIQALARSPKAGRLTTSPGWDPVPKGRMTTVDEKDTLRREALDEGLSIGKWLAKTAGSRETVKRALVDPSPAVYT